MMNLEKIRTVCVVYLAPTQGVVMDEPMPPGYGDIPVEAGTTLAKIERILFKHGAHDEVIDSMLRELQQNYCGQSEE
ncbi:hypothetical protein QU487_06390 [Crenobacter sp. SG2305]|uniref:hypothetical protein n=1 Tax=Crenobacter oryzisoli TaxID=3056844 RepID=UPI0025AA4891|nr:hypothetical protein [Crenobacter sp. SG2305]MDN0082381.1 hypothetical protein [Crenobacter sp. SG2305]